MIDCTTCAQALPISSCTDNLVIGTVADGVVDIAVKFTDLATQRVTIADVDPDALPDVVVVELPDFAPGHAVRVEVLTTESGIPEGPVEFFPLLAAADPSPYPVTCMVFTSVKNFTPDGSVYKPTIQYLILQ